MTIILISFFNKLSNHVNYRTNNLDQTQDARSSKTTSLVLNLLPQCLLREELSTVFRMTAGVFTGRCLRTKGTTKEWSCKCQKDENFKEKD